MESLFTQLSDKVWISIMKNVLLRLALIIKYEFMYIYIYIYILIIYEYWSWRCFVNGGFDGFVFYIPRLIMMFNTSKEQVRFCMWDWVLEGFMHYRYTVDWREDVKWMRKCKLSWSVPSTEGSHGIKDGLAARRHGLVVMKKIGRMQNSGSCHGNMFNVSCSLMPVEKIRNEVKVDT